MTRCYSAIPVKIETGWVCHPLVVEWAIRVFYTRFIRDNI